jgi:hypothetical protein
VEWFKEMVYDGRCLKLDGKQIFLKKTPADTSFIEMMNCRGKTYNHIDIELALRIYQETHPGATMKDMPLK